jgi:multidrug efflux system membrane fusion protein
MESNGNGARAQRGGVLGKVVVVLLIAFGIGWIGHFLATSTSSSPSGGERAGGRGGRGGMPTPVGASKATIADINVWLNGLGTVTPLRSVTVTAQVAGQLQGVAYREGQMVHRGDVLAQIDPRTYQAASSQAQGALARDQALLANARIDLQRFQTLFKEDSIAKQQLDTQQSLVRQYEGSIAADRGAVDAADVNLAYTKIVAPIDGRVGLRQVDPGNNVASGSAIVVITQLQPIDALFTIPEDSLPRVGKKMHAGETLAVDAYDRANRNKLASGTLASLDNQIDTSTGTVKAKAEFANDDESLFPNQFVNVRVLLDVLHGATVIPTSALQRGSSGLFVYVVGDDGTVSVRDIRTGPTEGERVAVTDGLKPGETVVTDGGDRLREGSKVTLPAEGGKGAASGAGASGEGDAGSASTSSGHHKGHGHWNGQHRPGGSGSDAQDRGSWHRDSASGASSGGSDGS